MPHRRSRAHGIRAQTFGDKQIDDMIAAPVNDRRHRLPVDVVEAAANQREALRREVDDRRRDVELAAQELTIGGRFKGTIQADRVMLTSSAVVDGEIYYRSLAIEENAWFAGSSRPKKTSATSEHTNPPSPIQLVPPDGNRQINGSLEMHAD
jgi:Polymer-forming cytoskeletal